jgi:hypothetical protein
MLFFAANSNISSVCGTEAVNDPLTLMSRKMSSRKGIVTSGGYWAPVSIASGVGSSSRAVGLLAIFESFGRVLR